MESIRSGTIVFDEAVATMKSAAQALKSSFQCMNCIVTLHHRPAPQLRRSGKFSTASNPPLIQYQMPPWQGPYAPTMRQIRLAVLMFTA
jgi:hypothetical protein